jgi:RNA polymerase subunit RPABC4/transcription elongation factor Spt4
MPDLPGYGGGVHCTNCHSINHQTQQCPWNEDDDTQTT